VNANLKIPFAFRDGKLIHISEVESGTRHGGVCPECQLPLVARKGAKNRHHFAHPAETSCNLESILHRIGKALLYSEIEGAIAAGREIPVTWKCSRCGDHHKGNLLRKARSVRLEHSFGVCRPDLVLFDEIDRPIVAIEVVVSHAPEEHAVQFLETEGIGLLEFHVESDFVLETIHPLTEFRATIGTVCTRKKCPECKAPLRTVKLFIGDGRCWKCRSKMKVALISRDWMKDGPSEFNATALTIAQQRGAVFRKRLPNDAGKRLLANSCPRCRSLTNEFFLMDYVYLAGRNDGVIVGFECSRCDWEKSV
jgi:ssDNA-binding Zn-finger/Zn-ribbon topoisomerase 1